MSASFVAQRGTVNVTIESDMTFQEARDAALLKAGYPYAAPRFRSRVLRVRTKGNIRRFRIIRAGTR